MLQWCANARVDPFFACRYGKRVGLLLVIDVTFSSGHLKAISQLILLPAGIVWPCPYYLAFKTRWPQRCCMLGMTLVPNSETKFHLIMIQVVCLLYLATSIKTSCLPLNNKHPWAFGFPANLLMHLVTLQALRTGYPRQGLWRWSSSVDHHFPEFRAVSTGALWAFHGAKKVKGRNKTFPKHWWGKWMFIFSEVLSFNHFPPTHWNVLIPSLVIDWAQFSKVCSCVLKPHEYSFLWWDDFLEFYFKSVLSYWPFTAKESDADVWRGTITLLNSIPFVPQ